MVMKYLNFDCLIHFCRLLKLNIVPTLHLSVPPLISSMCSTLRTLTLSLAAGAFKHLQYPGRPFKDIELKMQAVLICFLPINL